MSKLNRKNVITGVIIVVLIGLIFFTVLSNIIYNKNLPKATTVQALLDQYNISRKYEGEFSYTGLKSYTFPYDIRIDQILIREGDTVAKGDKLLKISLADPTSLTTITSQIEANKRELSLLNKQYQLSQSNYSPDLYLAGLEAELAELEKKSKELWYEINGGGIDLDIEILNREIALLLQENSSLIDHTAVTENDVAILEMEIQIHNLLESMDAAETEKEEEKYRQQYDVLGLKYDMLLQESNDDKRALDIKRNMAEILKKYEEKDLLEQKRTSRSTIPDQLAAKQRELENFKKSNVNEKTLELDSQRNAIENLNQQNELLIQSVAPLISIQEAGGFIEAEEDFVVYKITAELDAIHQAEQAIFMRTTGDSKPCFKWSTPKDTFQANFAVGGDVNVKYSNGSGDIYDSIEIASKIQLETTVEYIGVINEVKEPLYETEIMMSHHKDEYVTYLPKSALHMNSYGERVAYAVYQRDVFFTRESFVEELSVQILAEDEKYYIVSIATDGKEVQGYVADISMPIKDGDIIKVVKEFSEENPFSSKDMQASIN